MAQDRKRFIIRTELDGSELFIEGFDTHLSAFDFFSPFAGKPLIGKPTRNFGEPVLTEHISDALRLTENKAKAARKRAEKAYADIECTTEKGCRLHFEVVELQNTGRR